jgi:hypothetical protein
VTYPLLNVVLVSLCAVICGADDFVAIAQWGRAKWDWLSQFLDRSAGIPSHDRFNAIFAVWKPAEFGPCLLPVSGARGPARPVAVAGPEGDRRGAQQGPLTVGKRLTAGWGETCLQKVLCGSRVGVPSP